MLIINKTIYRLISYDRSVARIWTMYQRINPNHRVMELGKLLASLLPEGESYPFGSGGLLVSAEYEYVEKFTLSVLELKVEGKELPAPLIFHWLGQRMGGRIRVNYRMEAPGADLFFLHNEHFGFDEKFYVLGSGLFESLEGAYCSLDELFQGWSDETGHSLEGLTTEEKISFLNGFTDYDSDDDSLFIFPFL